MEELIVDYMPENWRDPLMILAFAGWNDAAESATAAAEFLVRSWSGRKFAHLDPEGFYHFALLRPLVRFKPGTEREREIIWPSNQFYRAEEAGLSRDVIIGVGVEPHLRWKSYCGHILDLARRCQVSLVVTLGAFLADVPHTRPTRVASVTTDLELARRLRSSFTRYEGPTGIVGVLNDCCRRSNLPVVSLWAQVPHYISEVRNPHAILALVERVQSLLDWKADLTLLEESARRFDAQLAEILDQNPQVAEHVRKLEEREEEEEWPGGGKGGKESSLELPSTAELMKEIEQFLRQHRGESEMEGGKS